MKPNYFGKCAWCGKEIVKYIPISDLKKEVVRCCSSSCKSKYQWKDKKQSLESKQRRCKRCGKTYLPCHGHKSQKYCSLECANALAVENSKSNDRVLKCDGCGDLFVRNLTEREMSKGKGRFCSKDCHNTSIAKQGDCPVCGKPLKGHSGDRYCSRKCFGISKRAENGHINPQGYVMQTVETGRRVNQHRYVMEQMLGRRLHDFEKVHHKNGERADNRPENLELWCIGHPSGQRVHDVYSKDIERLILEIKRLRDLLGDAEILKIA